MSTEANSTHEIVVLGANFGGVYITHYLFRQTIPILERRNASQKYHITLVSPNTHYFFKIAAPRAMVNETSIPTDKIFRSIPEAMTQYSPKFTFIQGTAEALEPEKRMVNIQKSDGSGTMGLQYDSLFICTGTMSASPLWTLHGSHEISVQAMRDLHKRLPAAKSVLIAGAGAAGVEAVGEIAAAFPEIKITLVARGDVLDKTKPAITSKMKKMLNAAGVEVIANVRVTGVLESGNGAKVKLDNDSEKDVDIFIDARGAKKVNSEFLPDSWLDESGRVVVLDEYFRVKGPSTENPPKNTYVIGDIVSGSRNSAIELDAQIPVVASSFAVDVTSKSDQASSGSGGGVLSWVPGLGSGEITQKKYKPMKDTVIIPFGPQGGVGQVMGWQVPSLMVRKAKAEKFFLEMVEPAISGTKYGKV